VPIQSSSRSSARQEDSIPVSEIHVARTQPLSDEELVRRAAFGDEWAEEAIYRRYAGMILGTARRLLADGAEAQDVAQETFATAFAAWASLRDPTRLRRWLLKIAIRLVHRRFRRRKLARLFGFEDGVDDATLDALARPDTSLEARAELLLIARALERVTPAARIAWMLRHVEGLPLDEVAIECDCSLSTTKRRIARAQRRIDRFLDKGKE
jgi:RNA polymerase sigma-70 factor (ECF subfamily)